MAQLRQYQIAYKTEVTFPKHFRTGGQQIIKAASKEEAERKFKKQYKPLGVKGCACYYVQLQTSEV